MTNKNTTIVSDVKKVGIIFALRRQSHLKSSDKVRITIGVLNDVSTGQLPVKSVAVKRIPSSPAMRGLMRSIQNSKLEPYNIVSDNLSQESKKSMEKLNVLFGEVGNSGEQTPLSSRRT